MLQLFSLLSLTPLRETEVNLHELQRTLDAQGLEIVENQKENVVGRKKLAEQTRGTYLHSPPPAPRTDCVISTLLTEFKKVADDEKGPAFKTLLKGPASLCSPHLDFRMNGMLTQLGGHSSAAYQSEIDNLTRRSKVAESAFLSVYKLLAEAPDPYPLLDAAVVSYHSPTHCPWSLITRSLIWCVSTSACIGSNGQSIGSENV